MAVQDQLILSSVDVDKLAAVLKELLAPELTKKVNEANLPERLLSANQVCALFTPKITRATVDNYVDRGFFNKYALGGRNWYKYSEVVAALKVIKKS
jgi:hypothetical protein